MNDLVPAALRLRRISSCLREGRPIPAEDAVPLSDGIERFLDGIVPSLDAAMGLQAGWEQLGAHVAAVELATSNLRRYIGRPPDGEPARPAPIILEPDRRADLVGVEWIETSVAAQRFEVSKVVIQSWCQRYDGFGWKRGGRWHVSVTKMRAKLGLT